MSTLTIDDIKEAMNRINLPERKPILDPFQPHNYFGIKFIAEPDPPAKFKLSDKVQVSDEFRQKFDLMLLETFGRQKSLTDDNKIYFTPNLNIAIANNKTIGIISDICA